MLKRQTAEEDVQRKIARLDPELEVDPSQPQPELHANTPGPEACSPGPAVSPFVDEYLYAWVRNSLGKSPATLFNDAEKVIEDDTELIGVLNQDRTSLQDSTLHKKTPRIIYVAGGNFRHPIDVFEGFNLDASNKCWSTLSRLTVPRSGLGAAFLKGLFYAVGGHNISPKSSDRIVNWVDVYNPATKLWKACKPMTTPRCRVGVAVMDGLLYAVGGGSDGSKCHKSVERYDPCEDKWTPVKEMKCARLGVGVAVVNRRLYAVGGFDGARYVDTAECYDPENDSWSDIADLTPGRSLAGVAAFDKYIYVVGGYDGKKPLASVDRYDTEKNVGWEAKTSMGTARSTLSLTVIDNKLYAMGGNDGTSFLDIVEVYSPAADAWEPGTPLTSLRAGHASAACDLHACAEPDPPAAASA